MSVVSLPPGVSDVRPGTVCSVSDRCVNWAGTVDLSCLSAGDQSKVKALLRKYQSVISTFEGDLGCTDLISHDIPLLDDAPIWQRYRRVPPSDYEAVRAHINQLLETQVIQESCSPCASPIVLVKKKNGSLRMCVDYCQLNSKTRKNAFPLPRIERSLWMC